MDLDQITRESFVRVGIGVIVLKGGKLLVGKRRGSHGAGSLAFPGGHQHFGETWEVCALREVEEETGLKVKYRWLTQDQEYAFVTNNIMPEDKRHYVTIFVLADHLGGEPVLLEPDSCESWQWLSWDEILENSSKHWLPKKELLKLRNDLGMT